MSNDEANPEYGKITDDAVAGLKARLGTTYPIEQPYVRSVNQDNITRWLVQSVTTTPSTSIPTTPPPHGSVGSLHHLHSCTRQHGEAGICVAVKGCPAFMVCTAGRVALFPPACSTVTRSTPPRCSSAERMQGRLAGDKMFIQADEIRFYNQNDELVAIQVMPIIRAEREESKKRGKYSSIEPATYTEADIAQIDKELENELPRAQPPGTGKTQSSARPSIRRSRVP